MTGHLRSSQTSTVTTAGGASEEVLHWFFLDRLTLDAPKWPAPSW